MIQLSGRVGITAVDMSLIMTIAVAFAVSMRVVVAVSMIMPVVFVA
jgi:hypothetical protein